MDYKIDNYDEVVKWSYSLAKKWVIEKLVPLGITSSRKFEQHKRNKQYLPVHFPKIPDDYFKRRGTWKGWSDFFGYPDNTQSKNFVSLEKASHIARQNNIKNRKQYREWADRPENLPARPELSYKNWPGWETFLGDQFEKPDPRHYSKLRIADVRIIKHQLSLGVSGATLAKNFGVSEMQISRIKSGENWNDI